MDTLIYIDDKEKLDASAAANAFAHKDVKNRAYINTLGAELALKYLASEDIDVSDTRNLHNIKKILEETDISDVMLENIHIDVRVVFDENTIFIPKSHFEYELTPDIYLVFNLVQDHSHVRFLGFFEPQLINKNNANSDYYFIEKEKLTPPNELINYIKTHHGNTNKEISDDDMENSERIIISMSDNDVSENDKKYLIKQLLKSAELRDKFIEYENFETLSYKAMNDPQIEKKEIVNNIVEELGTEFNENVVQDDFLDETSNDELEEETVSLDALDTTSLETEEIPQTFEEETVALDALDTSNFETEEIPQTFEEETVTLDALDTTSLETEEIPQTFEEETVTLDALDTTSLETEEIPQTFEEETVALDALDTSNFETEEIPQTFEEETVALDALDTSNFETEEIPQTFEEETVTLDALASTSLETEEIPQTFEEETVALDALDTSNFETEEIPQMFEEETVALDALDSANLENTEIPQDFEEAISLDTSDTENLENTDIETIDNSIFEELKNTEATAEIKELPQTISYNVELNAIDSIENVITDEVPDVIFPEEPLEKEEDLSFGKNLLENLSSSNDIEIANTELQSNENVSSNDLLAQIDDVLSSSSSAEEEYTENIDNLLNEDDKLNVLYNETDLDTPINESVQEETEELPTIPGAALYNKKNDNKKIITAALLLTILAASATFMFLKPKNNEDIEPITASTPIIPEQNNDILANTPEKPVNKDIQVPKPAVKELKNTPSKPIKSELSLNVNRLIWDVPDTLSYSPRMQNYLKTAGKSIKLSLSADLLLATEYAYTNQVKVGLKLGNSGAVKDAQILSSSGSTQIDNIVLQSVKDTLNVVKPPADEIKTPDFNLNLIIYF